MAVSHVHSVMVIRKPQKRCSPPHCICIFASLLYSYAILLVLTHPFVWNWCELQCQRGLCTSRVKSSCLLPSLGLVWIRRILDFTTYTLRETSYKEGGDVNYGVECRDFLCLVFSLMKINNDSHKESYFTHFKILHRCEGLYFGQILKHLVVIQFEFYCIPYPWYGSPVRISRV